MDNIIQPKLLREATPAQQAALLKKERARPGADPLKLTQELLSLVAAGSLSPVIMKMWISMNQDPDISAIALRQSKSMLARRAAIKDISRQLRKEATFQTTWDALGGSDGLAETMAFFGPGSVHDLCQGLAKTASAIEARHDRQLALTRLLAKLCPELGISGESCLPSLDARPLQMRYCHLVPACTPEAVLAWERSCKEQPHVFAFRKDAMQSSIWNTQRYVLERCALERALPSTADREVRLEELTPYTRHNFSFTVSSQDRNWPAMFWTLSPSDFRGKSSSSVDAYLAASLLQLSHDCGMGMSTDLLAKPFPGDEDPRFPALSLQRAFLERYASRPTRGRGPVKILNGILPHVPPHLLQQLVHSLLDDLNGDTATTSRGMMTVCKMLSKSDNPSLAAEAVRRFILERSDRSGWHQNLLNPRLVRYMSPTAATEFFSSLLDTLIEVHEQRDLECSTAPSEQQTDMKLSKGRAAGTLKVGTVKGFARLLERTESVPILVSLDILVRLGRVTRHIDARTAVLQDLIPAARRSGHAQVMRRVLDILKELAVPIVASLEEFKLKKKEDLAADKIEGALPTVMGSLEERPMTDMLMEMTLSDDSADRFEVWDLVYSAVRLSAEPNKQWMNLFLQKNGFSQLSTEELPPVPVLHDAPYKLLYAGDPFLIPLELFNLMKSYVMLSLRPSPALAEVTDTVANDAVLARSNGGQHWLALWNQRGIQALDLGCNWAIWNLNEFIELEKASEHLAVSSSMMEDFVFDVAKLLVEQADLSTFDWLVLLIAGQVDKHAPVLPTNGNGAIMKRINDHVSTLRTSSWRLDKNRQPPRLPDPLKLKLLMLVPPDDGFNDMVWDVDADQIIALLESIVRPERPYHQEFEQIKSHVGRNCGTDKRLEVAMALGLPDSVIVDNKDAEPSVLDHLRVELAAAVMVPLFWEKHVALEDEGWRKMVAAWEASGVESFRETARSLLSTDEKQQSSQYSEFDSDTSGW